MTVLDRIRTPGCDCDSAGVAPALASVPEAVTAALALARPVTGSEVVPLAAARGRVLARDVTARADMPRFDNAGMDGYALRAADLAEGAPLPLAGTCAAGEAAADLPPGAAMRIYTGAVLPRGADAVVMQEHARAGARTVEILTPPAPGANIRRRGEDRHAGQRVLRAGTRIDARAIAICAGAGAGEVRVHRRPRVALLLTGDEIVPAGQALPGGAIWDVNTPMLTGLAQEAGGEVVAVRQVPDDPAALRAALAEAAGAADMVITSGGVSVGDRDHLKPALQAAGGRIAVSGVAIKPGKPVTVGELDGAVVLALPGNPVSAFVTWQVLGRPVAARLGGSGAAQPPRRHVRPAEALRHKPGRCEFRPARLLGYDHTGVERVAAQGGTHSGRLDPLMQADGLVLIPGDRAEVPAGDLLEFLPF